jgi:hypothetical protein
MGPSVMQAQLTAQRMAALNGTLVFSSLSGLRVPVVGNFSLQVRWRYMSITLFMCLIFGVSRCIVCGGVGAVVLAVDVSLLVCSYMQCLLVLVLYTSVSKSLCAVAAALKSSHAAAPVLNVCLHSTDVTAPGLLAAHHELDLG